MLAPLAAVATPLLTLEKGDEAAAAAPSGFAFAPAELALATAPAVQLLPVLATALLLAAAAGALWSAVRLSLGARRSASVARRSRPAEAAAVLRALNEAERLGLRPPAVRVSAEVLRPVLVGSSRPTILLPEALAEGDGERLLLICRHELAHWARRDGLRLLLEEVVLGAFWFVPPLRALRRRAAAAREECCDARALRGAPTAERRAYAQTLIDALRLRAGTETRTAFTGADPKETAMRLHAILNPAVAARRPVALALGGLAVAAAALTGTGSAVLAQQAEGAAAAAGLRAAAQGVGVPHTTSSSTHTYRSVTTADEPGGATDVDITVHSDTHETQPGGAAVSSGNVRIKARGVPAGLIRVNGQPQPAGFDPATLNGRILRVETSGVDGEGQPSYNIVTR